MTALISISFINTAYSRQWAWLALLHGLPPVLKSTLPTVYAETFLQRSDQQAQKVSPIEVVLKGIGQMTELMVGEELARRWQQLATAEKRSVEALLRSMLDI